MLALAGLMIVAGCANHGVPAAFDDTSAAKTAKLTIVDVRTPAEFAKDKVQGSVNVPIDDLAARIATVAPDKSQPLAVHCQGGGRSARAKKALEAMGYSNVTDWGSLENAKAMSTRTSDGSMGQ